MTIVFADSCHCREFDKIGAPVWTIPGCEFGGILWLKDESAAISEWMRLKYMPHDFAGAFGRPRYWAVHLNGRHILNVMEKNVAANANRGGRAHNPRDTQEAQVLRPHSSSDVMD